MKKENIIKIITLVFNLFVFVSGITILFYILIYGYGTPADGPLGLHFYYLEFFTVLSNVYAAVVAGIIFFYLLKNVKKEEIELSKKLTYLHLSSATSLALTALTVICFLGPTQGFAIMYKEDMFLYHLFNPVLVVASFILLKKPHLTIKESIIGIIPMVLYGIVYSSTVLTHTWEDFYGFTFGGNWWTILIVLPIMICVTFLISLGLTLLSNLRQK